MDPFACHNAGRIQRERERSLPRHVVDIDVEKIAVNMKKTNPELSAMSPRGIFDRTIQDRNLLQREQTPEDVGRAVAFLASDDATEITGQALNVNGGALVD